jgi:hypothetical protein
MVFRTERAEARLKTLPAYHISDAMANESPKRDRLLRKLLDKRKARRERLVATNKARATKILAPLLGDKLLAAVEEWRLSQPATMTTEEAVRRLLERGLGRDDEA